jgi:heat shock protein HslJ
MIAMARLTVVVALGASWVTLGGGQAQGEGGAKSFEDRAWQVETFGPGGLEVIPESAPTLEFDVEAGAALGSGGCNRFRSFYESEGSHLTFGPAAATMMACAEEAVNLQEGAFMAALDAVTSVMHEADSLKMFDEGGELVLSFRPRVDLALVGPEWRLTAYNDGKEAVVSVLVGSSIVMTFGPDSVAGSAGCNRFQASVVVSGESLEIGMAAATRKFCGEPDGVMDQEAAFLVALPIAETFEIVGDQLDLRTTEGALVAAFTAIESGAQ